MTDNSKRNLPDPVNNDGPGVSRIETPITGAQQPMSGSDQAETSGNDPRDMMRERLERYAKMVKEQKQKMMDVDKEQLVDIIFRQNSLISQQSNQMVDLVNLVNELDSAPNASEESQASAASNVANAEEIQKNIDILKRRNELCQEADQMRQDSALMFSNSVRIQFVLFTLFILVLLWLLYHYMSFE